MELKVECAKALLTFEDKREVPRARTGVPFETASPEMKEGPAGRPSSRQRRCRS